MLRRTAASPFVDEIAVAGFAQQWHGELAGLAEVIGERQRLIDQVARVACRAAECLAA